MRATYPRLRGECGVTVVNYALILALLGLAAVPAITMFSDSVAGKYERDARWLTTGSWGEEAPPTDDPPPQCTDTACRLK